MRLSTRDSIGFKKTEGGGPVTFKVVREACVPFGDKSASDYAVLAKNKVVNKYKGEIPKVVRKTVTDGLAVTAPWTTGWQ